MMFNTLSRFDLRVSCEPTRMTPKGISRGDCHYFLFRVKIDEPCKRIDDVLEKPITFGRGPMVSIAIRAIGFRVDKTNLVPVVLCLASILWQVAQLCTYW